MISTTIIYLIACHGGPAAHFAKFAEELSREGHQVEILATGPAFEKLQNLGATEFNPDQLDIDDPASQQLLVEKTVKTLQEGALVITDVGHPIMAAMQKALAHEPTIRRYAYYDNPEPFVPGGYSVTAAKVMTCADKVLFSNKNLAKERLYSAPGIPIPLSLEKRIGIGYYPLAGAKWLECAKKARQEIVRRLFFREHHLEDHGQKILVYLGGNNQVFFEEAFPAFLQLVGKANLDPDEYIVVMQHHPSSKKKEIDFKTAGDFPILVSRTASEEALILADAVLYYQTSMGPQLILADIPVIQVGHEPYYDILVRNDLAPSATTREAFIEAIRTCRKPARTIQLLDDLGIAENWVEQLKTACSP